MCLVWERLKGEEGYFKCYTKYRQKGANHEKSDKKTTWTTRRGTCNRNHLPHGGLRNLARRKKQEVKRGVYSLHSSDGI